VNARKGDERRAANAAKVATTPPLEVLASGGKFSTILADPPWAYENEGLFGRGKPPYIVMPDSEIKALPIGRLADEECHLYLWATNASLLRAFYVLEAWGFRYATTITWCKATKTLEKPRYGMGYYFRGATEHMLFGVKGSMRLKRFDCPTLVSGCGRSGRTLQQAGGSLSADRVVLARPLFGTVRASCTSWLAGMGFRGVNRRVGLIRASRYDVVFHLNRLDMSARESDECEGYEISSAASCHGESADCKAAAKAL
jgi:MT-A70